MSVFYPSFDPSLNFPLILIFTAILSILFFTWRKINEIRKLPNGPWGLPIFGYMLFLQRHDYLQYIELSKKYGGVFSMKLGEYNIVVVNDWPSMKEAMASEELLARPEMSFFPGVVDDKSFIELSGSGWRDQRRIAIRILRDIGLGKSAMEVKVDDEISQFIKLLDQNVGKPSDIVPVLYPSVSNIISLLIFGHGFSYTDPDKLALDKGLDYLTKSAQFGGIGVFMPTLAKILSRLGFIKSDEMLAQIMALETYSQKEISFHRSGNKKGNMEDYIDGYLEECENRKTRKMDLDTFNNVTLRRNITELFGAGSDTVRITLTWIMLYLVKYPKFQERIRQEIDSVVGKDRRPNFQDRLLMPFTMAFIYEVQRVASIVATNLLRRASNEVRIGSHTLPKDTIVIFNFYAVHHDPKLWNEPEKFDPERFLTDNGSKAVRPAYHVPFSGGKRICPGESLAYLEIFLYTTNIIQRYRVESADEDVSTEAGFGATRYPEKMPLLIFEKIN